MNTFLAKLGLAHPIVQAPMAGITTPALAATACNAGALGSLGCADFSPDHLREQVRELRSRTKGPFNLNFFVHREPVLDGFDAGPMRKRLALYYTELGLGDVPAPRPPYPSFTREMLGVVAQLKPAVVSFHFGLPDASALATLRNAGAMIFGCATSVAEARHLEAEGVDAVVAQGWEAGGHRGVFLDFLDAQSAGTLALTRQIAAAVKLPVIAAGGIADGRGIEAALALGAAAAQLGSAFMLCPEARTNPVHRDAIAKARDDESLVTRLFSGRPARVLANRFTREMSDAESLAAPFPAHRAMIAPLIKASLERGSPDFLSLFAGQAAGLARSKPAETLMTELIAGYQ